MKLFSLLLLICYSSLASAQTFEAAKKNSEISYLEGSIEGSLEEGLPITYSEKGVVFLLTDLTEKADTVWYDKPVKYLGISSKILVRGRYKNGKFIASDVFTQSLMDDREVAEMATVFRKEGRIYVVIIVFGILLSGLIFYLVLLDRKVKNLEKE